MTEPANRPTPLSTVVLISGGGSNLQALIDGEQSGELPIRIRAVISNRAGVAGLERARQAGIDACLLDHKTFADRDAFDQALGDLIQSYEPGLLVLAGFMRILTPGFVSRFSGRMFNIHPSLLPKYPGLHTHQRALDAGDTEAGATVHFVTEELDGGPRVLQARVPVLPGDDANRLAARVLEKEHIIYPLTMRWFAQGRLRLNHGGIPELDDNPLSEPIQLDALPAAER